ncbi:MAG: hypothetical protein U5R31_15095 [Acidimicrobiia bacterium]|nr:hypothetical protein [Acidimicrobiia bacterium]
MADHLPRPPVHLDRVFDAPAIVEGLLARHEPYWPVQRYLANRAEYATLSGGSGRRRPGGRGASRPGLPRRLGLRRRGAPTASSPSWATTPSPTGRAGSSGRRSCGPTPST